MASEDLSLPPVPERINSVINRHLQNDQLYEAHQIAKTFVFRFKNKGQNLLAVSFCKDLAEKFAERGEDMLALDLLGCILTTFEESGDPPTSAHINMLLRIFGLCKSPNKAACQTKNKFINKASRWTRSEAHPYGDLRVHRAAALANLECKNYGLCQGHLVYCKDADLLAQLMNEWIPQGYPSERPFFWLRLVLMLLCLNDIQTAERLMQTHAGVDWAAKDIPAPLQLAYLLIVVCKNKLVRLFDVLQSKYHLVYRRDPSIFSYTDHLKKINGCARAPQSFNLMGMLSNMLAAATEDTEE